MYLQSELRNKLLAGAKMKIKQKLIMGFATTALLVAIVGYVSVSMSQKIMQKTIGQNSVVLAKEIIDRAC